MKKIIGISLRRGFQRCGPGSEVNEPHQHIVFSQAQALSNQFVPGHDPSPPISTYLLGEGRINQILSGSSGRQNLLLGRHLGVLYRRGNGHDHQRCPMRHATKTLALRFTQARIVGQCRLLIQRPQAVQPLTFHLQKTPRFQTAMIRSSQSRSVHDLALLNCGSWRCHLAARYAV